MVYAFMKGLELSCGLFFIINYLSVINFIEMASFVASSISNLKNRQQAWKGNVIEAKVFSAQWPVAKKGRKKEFQRRVMAEFFFSFFFFFEVEIVTCGDSLKQLVGVIPALS